MNAVWSLIWGNLAKSLVGISNILTIWEQGTALGAYVVESSSDDIKSSWSAKHAIRVMEDQTSIKEAEAKANEAQLLLRKKLGISI
jgi:hypothetical protein